MWFIWLKQFLEQPRVIKSLMSPSLQMEKWKYAEILVFQRGLKFSEKQSRDFSPSPRLCCPDLCQPLTTGAPEMPQTSVSCWSPTCPQT